MEEVIGTSGEGSGGMDDQEGSGSGSGDSYDYDYDYDCGEEPTQQELDLLHQINLYLGGHATLIVAIVGIVANTLAIAVFCRRGFKSNFNNLLIALAVFDLFFLVTMITESIRNNFESRFGDPTTFGGKLTQIHHHLFPYFIFPVMNILLTSSVYMTVSISVERYVAIFYPLVYKARSQGRTCGGSSLSWHIIPVLLISILVNIPTFFSSQVDYWTEEHWNYEYMQQMNATMPSLNSTLIGVTAVRKHPIYSFYYQNLTRFVLLGLLPMLLLIILNVRVFSAIQARKSTCRDASYAHILLLVVLVFLLCQSPRLFLNFWELFLDLECGPPVWYQMLHVISNWLIALNSATNFFIYCLAGAKFRQGLAVMLGCRSPAPIGPPSTSHTAVDLKSYTTRL